MLRPCAKEVKPLDGYKILLTFDTGEKKIYNMEPRLNDGFFSSLKDKLLFETVKVNGMTVEWDNEIDLCPDDLYYNSFVTEL